MRIALLRPYAGNGIKVARLAWDQKAPVRLPASPTNSKETAILGSTLNGKAAGCGVVA